MLDHRAFLKDHDALTKKLQTRGVDIALLNRLTALIEERRNLVQKTEGMRHDLNEASAAIQVKVKSGDPKAAEDARTSLKALKADIKTSEDLLRV